MSGRFRPQGARSSCRLDGRFQSQPLDGRIEERAANPLTGAAAAYSYVIGPLNLSGAALRPCTDAWGGPL